jgi:hypothetical protein
MFDRVARLVYRANRARRTVRAVANGDHRRVARLYELRALWRLATRIINRLVK